MRRQLLVGGALLLGSTTLSLFAAEIYPKASRKTSQQSLDANTMIARLDQMLTEEQQVFQSLEDMKRELAIVKVRASTPKPCQ